MSKKKRDHKKVIARYKRRRKISASMSADFKVEDWFDKNIRPELENLDSQIMSARSTDENLIMVKYWWQAFYQNSINVANLVGSPSAHYQVAATMRLLLEISADVGFINEHPKNIKQIVDVQNSIAKKQEENSEYSYRNATEDAQRIKLHAYSTSNKQKFMKTEDRITFIYGKMYDQTMVATIKSIYGLFSIYSHFNAAAIVWEGNKTRVTISLNEALQDNLHLFSFYPLFLNCIVISIANLLSEDSLRQYGEDKIESLFDSMKKLEGV